jgi:hypothetical protein
LDKSLVVKDTLFETVGKAGESLVDVGTPSKLRFKMALILALLFL